MRASTNFSWGSESNPVLGGDGRVFSEQAVFTSAEEVDDFRWLSFSSILTFLYERSLRVGVWISLLRSKLVVASERVFDDFLFLGVKEAVRLTSKLGKTGVFSSLFYRKISFKDRWKVGIEFIW